MNDYLNKMMSRLFHSRTSRSNKKHSVRPVNVQPDKSIGPEFESISSNRRNKSITLDSAESRKTPETLNAARLNEHLNQHDVFDPALKHFTNGFRISEPQFQDAADAFEWKQHRSKVIRHILSRIQNSRYSQNMVLRGSVLLPAWLGENARNPGDLDWILMPESSQSSYAHNAEQCTLIARLLRNTEVDDSIRIPDKNFAKDEIWMYEKNPGLRVIVPWEATNHKNNGSVQMDFVFGEILPSPPVETDVLIGDLPSIRMRTASPEQALAWKLLWLATDEYVMGKDLYDAVLLAECTAIEATLIKQTFEIGSDENQTVAGALHPEEIRSWIIEWEDFMLEYPNVSGTEAEWKERLIVALKPILQKLREIS